MLPDHDPVDRALESLRVSSWTPTNPNPLLEEKLMQEFSKNRTSRFVARRPALVIACAAFLIGGGAFAAAGGVDLIKRLFVTVDIAGTPVQLELQPVGDNTYEGSLDTQIGEGRQAQIHVKRVEAHPNELNTQVHVNVTDGGAQIENESHVAIGKSFNFGPESSTTYTAADLGEAEPVHEWTAANGDGRAIYLIPTDDRQIRVFSVTTTTDGTASVKMLTKLPAGMGFDETPEVAVDDNGMITMTWGSEEGDQAHRREIRLIDRQSGDPADLKDLLNLATPDGEIKVKIDTEVKPDDQ